MLVALILVSSEVMIRIGTALLKINLDSSYGYPTDLFVEDPELGFALKPGFAGNFPNPPYDHIPIRINDDGYRDRPFPPQSDGTRIVVIGDSITFGAGIRAEERFTEALQQRCGGRCEVFNLGVNNYQAENYLAQMRTKVEDLAPDVVVIGFCMNDIRSKATIHDLDKARRTGITNRIRGILSHSQLVRVGSAVWRALTLDAEAYDERWIRLAIDAWSSESNRARLVEALREIQSRAQANEAKLVVVLFPEKHQLENFEAYGLPYKMAEKTMKELGIPVVSLHSRISRAIDSGELEAGEIFLPRDNVHYQPRVHSWIADVMIDELRDIMIPESRVQ